MPARPPAPRLGDADLGRQRHALGLFDGPQDAADVLVPFVIDGLRAGERVIHVVEDRDAYLDNLARHTDVGPAIASGRLDVRAWDEAYLSAGRFDAARMLAYIRRSLREAKALGFPATRLIGDMEWAREGVSGVDELLAYEGALDRILARPRVAVVCAYDTQQHAASRIAAVTAIHDVAVMGHRVVKAGKGAGPMAEPRRRILAAAALLFAENGVARTGVDALIEAAGVAKATFYRHFPSKDALVLAWLQEPETRWFDRVRATAEARAASSREVISRLFEAVAEWLEAEDYLGCPYLNAAVEIADPNVPAARTIQTYLAEIRRYLDASAAAAGMPEPARFGGELHALLAGAITLGVATRSGDAALAARDAAVALLDRGSAGAKSVSATRRSRPRSARTGP
jgi:AcrR family transcriptional regulator